MSEKETVMVLKVVDLQCPCCCKKLKKILCKFPQIRDQTYNKKVNTVTITVFCCNPEKIRDKLCCKGSKVIYSIEIKDPQKSKNDKKKTDTDDGKDQERDTHAVGTGTGFRVISPPKSSPPRTCCQQCSKGQVGGPCNHGNRARTCCQQCSEARGGGPCNHGQETRTCCQQCAEGRGGGPCYHRLVGYRLVGYHSYQPQPCCRQCAEGHGGGPCYHGLGYHPYPPQPCYCGCGGYGHGNEHSGGYHYCYTEESPQNCSIV